MARRRALPTDQAHSTASKPSRELHFQGSVGDLVVLRARGLALVGRVTDPEFMSQAVHAKYTHLLRTGSFDLWQRLRVLLGEQGLDPAKTVVVDLFPDGSDREFGQVISEDGRVYRFDLCYDRSRPQSVRKAALERWTDITESWQAESLRDRTADAFIWAPPSIQTHLTAQATNDQPQSAT